MFGIIEIYKNYNTREQEGGFSNTYEFFVDIAPEIESEVLPAIEAAERVIELEQVQFLSWKAGVYLANSDNLDPSIAPSGGLSGTGTRVLGGGHPLDLNTCYILKFATGSRAFGKKAYRGVLVENDVNSFTTGRWQLEAASALQPGAGLWTSYMSQLSTLINPAAGLPSLGCYTRFQTSPRGAEPKTFGPFTFYPVSSVSFLKVGNVKMNHRWFNRTG